MAFKNIIRISYVILTIISFDVSAALVPRLGGLAFYDTDSDLTWLSDANAAGTSMSWSNANAWAMSLDVSGVTGWRLPDTVDVGNDGATYTNLYQGVDYGFNITTPSELSNMFYNVLGNSAYYNTSGQSTGNCNYPDYCLTNTGPFANLNPTFYWSATEYAANTEYAWVFNMGAGDQKDILKSGPGQAYAWAVHSGDVAAVPTPAAVWLFVSGLFMLAGLQRKRSGYLNDHKV